MAKTTLVIFFSLMVFKNIMSICEKFGYNDSLICHCNGGPCNKETGVCFSRICQQGWSGPSCQRQNVALNKPATQSSYYSFPYPGISDDVMSGYAVDGDTKHGTILGLKPDESKCVDLYAKNSGTGWWSVDLLQTYNLNTIEIYHRTIPAGYERFHKAAVHIVNEDGQSTKCYQNTVEPSSPVFGIDCVGSGRYLNFTQSFGERVLNLCEIKVYVCSLGTFDDNCTSFCYCKNNARCDDVTGACPDGCLPGWTGRNCNQICQSGFYGDGCLLNCSERKCSTESSSSCDHVAGGCDGRCESGYDGIDCTKVDSTYQPCFTSTDTNVVLPFVIAIVITIAVVLVVEGFIVAGILLYRRLKAKSDREYTSAMHTRQPEGLYAVLSPRTQSPISNRQ